MVSRPKGETRERVYRFVREQLMEGSPPTVREVQRAMGFAAVESARKQMEALVAEGRLVKTPGRSRSYRLAPGESVPVSGAILVPLLERIAGGELDSALLQPDSQMMIDGRGTGEELFGLRVRCDSMSGAGILHGDVVLVRRQVRVANGETAVVVLAGEAAVRRVRLGLRTLLEPANQAFRAMTIEPQQLRVLGKVIEVRRRMD